MFVKTVFQSAFNSFLYVLFVTAVALYHHAREGMMSYQNFVVFQHGNWRRNKLVFL